MNRADVINLRPPRIAMGMTLIAIAVHAVVNVPVHGVLPLAATIVGTTGLALMLRAWWLFKVAGTAICPTETASALITHDVFSVSRNPMYLGITMMLAALALGIGALPFYVAAASYFAVMDRVFCPFEELKSLQEFGDAYTSYTGRVRRWL